MSRTNQIVDGQTSPSPRSARSGNALVNESSPYLLQHAHNPVAWRPWNEAALEEARRGDKPIFLSIGYSTCHWCHVMEEESFEDEEIAQAINEAFIPIKVDREERPDIDGVYMTAVQALTGHGGWPMSVFLTPDGKPFFAGTYFPARDGERGARMGFLSIVRRLGEAWRTDRARVTGSADEITRELQPFFRSANPTDLPSLDVVTKAVGFFSSRYDEEWGGLSPAPKFPSSLPLRALLRHAARTGDDSSLEMARTTFLRMARGGIHDQVGGGFHRYSTDERWLVPHFEKMLYDNALLVMAALELRQATPGAQGEVFADVARSTLTYIEREMTSPAGAFYSATDADSETPDGKRAEGWYFTWTPKEVIDVLGAERAHLCLAAWDISERGNFEGEDGEVRSIPWLPRPLEEVAAAQGVSLDELKMALDHGRAALLAARSQRPSPFRDDKIVTAWNGLMISAFARASFVLDEPRYLEIATRAARFILDNNRTVDGRLTRIHKEGAPKSAASGMLDDHAFFLQALLDLFEAGGLALHADLLTEARALEGLIAKHFEDLEHGGFFLTPHDGEPLLAREKPAHDGAEPSGNSVHALNLARLAALLDDDALRARATRTVQAFGQVLGHRPAALAEMLLALEMLHAAPQEIVVVTQGPLQQARELLAPLRRSFIPNRVLIPVRQQDIATLATDVPHVEGREAIDGQPTVYVCERRACRLPATTAEALQASIESARQPAR